MYISRASNFRDIRDLSKVAKLNTREFLELSITMNICIEYQHFRDMICNIPGIM